MPDATLRHRTRRMSGRDPQEEHRAATTLELLFDLTFVVAFGTAANALAHALAEDHVGAGILGFAFATFGISWAWINFTWFASAYDTDDWFYRLTTMLQMIGVLVFALGLPGMFNSIHRGDTLDNDIMVWGYVVMRIPMLVQWWRATVEDPDRREVHRLYVVTILVSQVLWCGIALVDLSVATTFVVMCVPLLIEMGGPFLAERRYGGTPWHAHHVAERYGLMVIIALGEGMIGTMASLTALSEEGVTVEVATLAAAGTAVTFGMWWTYFSLPHGEILHLRRNRSFAWGYGHIPLFGAIVAVGAGLHVAAYYLDHHSALGPVATVLAVAIPLGAYLIALYAFYGIVSRSLDPFHLMLIAGTLVVVVVPVFMAADQVDMKWCLLVLSLAPWVTVVGYEAHGYRHSEQVLTELEG